MTLHALKSKLATACPIRDVVDRVGDRWTVLVLTELGAGTLRFGELRARIPDVSQRMLAQTLRRLEEDGFVAREVFPTSPPKVEYSLTALGRSFMAPVRAIVEWAAENHEAVRAARAAYGGRPAAPPAK
jgi:DNA-binding HxlR family transcriptional regulator